jgi:hypothetical protein
MTANQFNAALGFAFVVVAAALSFGWAVLALVAAAGFYVIGGFLHGENTLLDFQERLQSFAHPRRSSEPPRPAPSQSRAPRVS